MCLRICRSYLFLRTFFILILELVYRHRRETFIKLNFHKEKFHLDGEDNLCEKVIASNVYLKESRGPSPVFDIRSSYLKSLARRAHRDLP